MEREKILEILVSLILLVLIFIMILVGTNLDRQSQSNTIISNSYNDNSEKNYYTTTFASKEFKTPPKKEYYYKDLPKKQFYYEYPKSYDSWGNHKKNADFNYYCDIYEVHIKNYERKGEYFTVRFYFENGVNEVKTYDIRKYIPAGDEEIFYFSDISKNKYEYYDWYYEVFK